MWRTVNTMPTTTRYDLVDRLLDGDLARQLEELHNDGLGVRRIATWFDREHGVQVSHETVRRWLRAEEVKSA